MWNRCFYFFHNWICYSESCYCVKQSIGLLRLSTRCAGKSLNRKRENKLQIWHPGEITLSDQYNSKHCHKQLLLIISRCRSVCPPVAFRRSVYLCCALIASCSRTLELARAFGDGNAQLPAHLPIAYLYRVLAYDINVETADIPSQK